MIDNLEFGDAIKTAELRPVQYCMHEVTLLK